jgi:antibiotic biosynthesis monooxygenase (ABM) superfamily enzyme
MSNKKPLPNTLFELIEEVQREIDTRKRVYPGWIASGKIKREVAEHRYLCMVAILKKLQKEQADIVGHQTRLWDDPNPDTTPTETKVESLTIEGKPSVFQNPLPPLT